MTIDNWEDHIRSIIEGFPEPHREEILQLWEEWLRTNPETPLFESWERFSVKSDNQDALYTEKRVYLKRVKNDLRDIEIPLNFWQKAAKAIAAVASVFLILFLAISRVFRATD
ncbi:MAG: hypothetical protein JW779_13345 [Candidatus Thorarchaeota archaeon]|nr:hypothetical protein [Candidatus Thorarchaeota archaeon]